MTYDKEKLISSYLSFKSFSVVVVTFCLINSKVANEMLFLKFCKLNTEHDVRFTFQTLKFYGNDCFSSDEVT